MICISDAKYLSFYPLGRINGEVKINEKRDLFFRLVDYQHFGMDNLWKGPMLAH